MPLNNPTPSDYVLLKTVIGDNTSPLLIADSLPQTYKDLIFFLEGRSTFATTDTFFMQINGLGGSNYNYSGTSGGAGLLAVSNELENGGSLFDSVNVAGADALHWNILSQCSGTIFNYADDLMPKQYEAKVRGILNDSEINLDAGYTTNICGTFRVPTTDTPAVQFLSAQLLNGNWTAYSSLRVYGRK